MLVKSSPDSFFQAALQFAFFKKHKRMASTYETGSTRRFLHGRTETIRVCCSEGKEMAETLIDSSKGSIERVHAVRTFLSAHRQLLQDATSAQGVDRHLLGLRCMLQKGEAHPFFTDPLSLRSTSFDLSTSNVSPGDLYDGLGFGPATAVGYGINYSLSRDSIRYCVTCYKDSNDSSRSLKFIALIEDCMSQIYELLSNHLDSKI